MKFWKHGNDLYTGDVLPVEGAIEIAEEEYNQIYSTRTITHLPEVAETEEGDA